MPLVQHMFHIGRSSFPRLACDLDRACRCGLATNYQSNPVDSPRLRHKIFLSARLCSLRSHTILLRGREGGREGRQPPGFYFNIARLTTACLCGLMDLKTLSRRKLLTLSYPSVVRSDSTLIMLPRDVQSY